MKRSLLYARVTYAFYGKPEPRNKSFAVLKIMRMRQSTVSTLYQTNSPMIVLNQRLGFASPSLLMVQHLLPWLHAQLISRNFLYHTQPYVQGESKQPDCVRKWRSYYRLLSYTPLAIFLLTPCLTAWTLHRARLPSPARPESSPSPPDCRSRLWLADKSHGRRVIGWAPGEASMDHWEELLAPSR